MKRSILFAGILLTGLAGFLLPPVSFKQECFSTTMTGAEGQLLGARIAADGQWRFPPGGALPHPYKVALVTFEDRRFYYHPGVDALAIGRALATNIKNKKILEGGSTLSMQTIRLMRKGKARTLWEKCIEAALAVRLETHYSKDEILALYAQHAPFGGNAVGIDAAAWRYFGHPASDLSWGEAATLAVLPNAPGLIHPGRNRKQLLDKRNKLLARLCARGHFPKEDLAPAQSEPLPDAPLPLPAEAPHLLERLAKTMEGTNIRTTIRHDLQQRVTETVNRHAGRLRGNSVHNMAALIIDNETQCVIAYAGNAAGSGSRGGQVDMITAPRSTGSILKPLLYAAMIDEGRLLPDMLVPDVPTYISGFAPQNYDKTFSGAVAAHRALERSLNIPAVLLLQEYGVERFHALLQKAGLTTILYPPPHYGLSLILGGAEVTLSDITGVYAAMARTLHHFAQRSGQYSPDDWRPPLLTPGDTAATSPAPLQPGGIISAAACWQIFNSLAEVNRPEGEEEWRRFPSSRKIAWKTGTSFGNRDAWAVGVTPQYTIGVWAGNASGEGRPLLTGVAAAAPALFELFNLLPPTTWFSQPCDEMTRAPLCRQSGHRATEYCTGVDTLWIANSGRDTPPCPYHILIHLDRTERFRVTADCEDPCRIIPKPWFVLPPVQEYFYRNTSHSYKQLPPFHPGCLSPVPPAQQRTMDLLYPQNAFRIVLARQMNGTTGQLIMQAAHRRAGATIYWHLDKQYLGATRPPHQMPAAPSEGKHTLTLVDSEGNTLSNYFYVDGN
ncbi:MAG: penicillin-binding protein 1C [Prevotellaceae bacterium]|jgi:penicillin-binding protein 1C|nr:penicillin-binding protein 1C [Prevotellaceae bacterium]